MSTEANGRLWIYDLEEENEAVLSAAAEDDVLFSARPMVKNCIGCFGCWVKTPGKCVIQDRCGVLPGYLSKSSEVIVISPMCYGGYSLAVKATLDRSIGYLLPYFQIVDGGMHHRMRYDNPFMLRVYFYGKCSEEEREIAGRLVKANAMNLGAGEWEVRFYDAAEKIGKGMERK